MIVLKFEFVYIFIIVNVSFGYIILIFIFLIGGYVKIIFYKEKIFIIILMY